MLTQSAAIATITTAAEPASTATIATEPAIAATVMPTSAIVGLAVAAKPVVTRPVVARPASAAMPASAARPASATAITSTVIMFATIEIASSPEQPIVVFTPSSSFHSLRFSQHFVSIAECLRVYAGQRWRACSDRQFGSVGQAAAIMVASCSSVAFGLGTRRRVAGTVRRTCWLMD